VAVRLLSFSLFPIALLSVFTLQTPAQTTASVDPDQTPVFRANARAVLVDVVVTDSQGNPVSGLRQQDFKLRENGKPESVVFFEEHKGAEIVPIELPKMPPNVFTNVPVAPQADALNVLLLDAMNTPQTDQSYVRAQVLEFLKTMKPGTPLAVFSLATDLRLVQGFTGSPSTLLASLQDKKNGVWPETTAFSHSTKDDLDDQAELNRRLMMLGGPGHTDAGIDALRQDQQNEKVYQSVQRVAVTAEALENIARYLAKIPGRKNLIWFASRFPMAFFPVASGNGALAVGRRTGGLAPAENIRIESGKLKETADLLTVSRVAIYPVGARGVETVIAGVADQPYMPVAGDTQEQREIIANYWTMRELASETGGEMTTGTNDLSKAIAHAIDNGSHFYTLS
jgi:VWFA-related protein